MDDRPHPTRIDVQRCERDRQFETSSAGTSGIQVEYAVYRLNPRHMRMAGDDDVNAQFSGIEPQRVQIVKNIERPAGEADEFSIGIFARPIGGVHVPFDRRDRRDPLERVDDVGIADVTAVNDMVDARQSALSFRP